jgi:hypothetical protein
MKLAQKIFLPPVLSLLTGCASVITGDVQSVTINVKCKNYIYEAYCVAENKRGKWEFYTPATKEIKKDSSPLVVSCNSSFENSRLIQYPGLNIFTIGNAVIGGVFGVIIDSSKNTIWAYPSVIEIKNNLCEMVAE